MQNDGSGGADVVTVSIDHSIAHRMTELGPAPFNNDILGPILNFDVLLHIIDQSESRRV